MTLPKDILDAIDGEERGTQPPRFTDQQADIVRECRKRGIGDSGIVRVLQSNGGFKMGRYAFAARCGVMAGEDAAK